MEDRDFKGIWIPKEIWLNKELTPLEKIILLEIDSLDCTEDGCYASNEYLAEFCQCTDTKISLAVSKLIKMGLLEVIKFDGRKRYLKSRLKEIYRQPLKKLKADFKKVKDINITNNINNNIIRIYEEEIGLLTPYQLEKLSSYFDDLSEEMIIEAIKRASKMNKKSLAYIEGILNNWINNGYKRIGDIKENVRDNNKKFDNDIKRKDLVDLYDN